jgi:hypothetical protein
MNFECYSKDGTFLAKYNEMQIDHAIYKCDREFNPTKSDFLIYVRQGNTITGHIVKRQRLENPIVTAIFDNLSKQSTTVTMRRHTVIEPAETPIEIKLKIFQIE